MQLIILVKILLLTIKNVMKRTVLVQKLFVFGRSHLCIFLMDFSEIFTEDGGIDS